MSAKSQVSSIFPQFKMLVEKRFQSTTKALYSDNGGEFLKLKPYLSNHGISHYTTAPHTPPKNGVTERRPEILPCFMMPPYLSLIGLMHFKLLLIL